MYNAFSQTPAARPDPRAKRDRVRTGRNRIDRSGRHRFIEFLESSGGKRAGDEGFI